LSTRSASPRRRSARSGDEFYGLPFNRPASVALGTRERRARNRRLLRAAEVLQKHHVLPLIRERAPYKLIWWRSATIVMEHRRVLKIADGAAPIQWSNDWHAPDLYNVRKEVLEAEIASVE